MSLQSNQTKEALIFHEPTSKALGESCHWHLHTWWLELSLHSRLLLWVLRSGSVTQKNRNCYLKDISSLMAMNHLLTLQNFELFAIIWDWACNQLPDYPQSNGRVENAVKTAKSLIKKAKSIRGQLFSFSTELEEDPNGGAEHLASSEYVLATYANPPLRTSRHWWKGRQSE